MCDNDDSVYTSLVEFLQSTRTDLLEKSTDAVLTIVSTADREKSMASLLKHGAIPPLVRLINNPSQIGRASVSALLHLTSDEKIGRASTEQVLDCRGVHRVVEVGLSFVVDDKENSEYLNQAMALLSNLTREERGAADLVRTDKEGEVSCDLELLVGRFISSSKMKQKDTAMPLNLSHLLEGEFEMEEDDDEDDDEETNGKDDPYQHVSSVLQNITQSESGRRFAMRYKTISSATSGTVQILPPLVKEFLKQLCYASNITRRRGAAGMIKNCCFESSVIKIWILPLRSSSLNDEEDDILFQLLYPLVGPEEQPSDPSDQCLLGTDLLSIWGNKHRERDGNVRLLILEILLLVCAAGRICREVLREKGLYVVLKTMDLTEEREDVSALISDCVQYMKRDEDWRTEGSRDELA